MDAWQGPRFQKRRCSYGPDQGDMLARPGLAISRHRHHLPKALRPAEGNGPQPQTLLAFLFPALGASPRCLSPLSPGMVSEALEPFLLYPPCGTLRWVSTIFRRLNIMATSTFWNLLLCPRVPL